MSDGCAELQIAIHGVLSALAPPLGNGVFAPAAQDQKLPYVEIGDSDAVMADVQCRPGLDETIDIHVWAPPADRIVPKEIMSRIREALHFAALPVAGRSSAHIRVTSTRLFSDADGHALHGVVTVTISHFGQEEA